MLNGRSNMNGRDVGRLGGITAVWAWVLIAVQGICPAAEPAAGAPAAARAPAGTGAGAPVVTGPNVPKVGGFKKTTVAGGLDHPWGMVFLPNGDILVTERPGRMRIVRGGKLVEQPIEGVP